MYSENPAVVSCPKPSIFRESSSPAAMGGWRYLIWSAATSDGLAVLDGVEGGRPERDRLLGARANLMEESGAQQIQFST